ncbi:MAG: peptidyl-prolyl cis-trans isomerase [Lentisphaerae bacterium]|nr:peptidyl-prolyl cis-trans isomerase [Lentisphaerota bacterium]
MKTLLPALLVALVAGGVWAVDPVVPNPAPSIPSEEKPAMPATKNPTVRLSTSMGDVTIELYPEQAPVSVSNFLAYVDSDFYNGTVFHRVIPGFMIQGGGFTAEMGQKPTRAAIKNEADNGLLNTRGTLAMARTMVVDSATSQFFVNTVDNTFLNFKNKTPQGYGYAVFGKVIDGMDVIDKIEKVRTGNKGPHQNVPVEAVTILKAERLAAPAE